MIDRIRRLCLVLSAGLAAPALAAPDPYAVETHTESAPPAFDGHKGRLVAVAIRVSGYATVSLTMPPPPQPSVSYDITSNIYAYIAGLSVVAPAAAKGSLAASPADQTITLQGSGRRMMTGADDLKKFTNTGILNFTASADLPKGSLGVDPMAAKVAVAAKLTSTCISYTYVPLRLLRTVPRPPTFPVRMRLPTGC